MRPLLRLTALLVQLLILQGAFLGGGPTCALAAPAHAPASAAAARAHHGSHRMPATTGHASHDGGQQHRQQQHAPSHCAAAGACVTAAALGGRTVILPASVELLAARAGVATFDAPHSVGTAPDTPPPRA